MRFDILTDEEVEQLSKIRGVLSEKHYTPPQRNEEVEKLREFYSTKVRPYPADSNSKFLIDLMEKVKALPEEPIRGTDVIEGGYEITSLPAGTLFYKALTWFFDTMPPGDRIWLGTLKVAASYMHSYFAGIMAYRARNPIRSFYMNNANMTKLYEEPDTPNDIKTIIEDIFGIGTTLENRLIKKRTPTWLVQSAECEDRAEMVNYGVLDRRTFRETQHKLIEYIENKFNCNSTILTPTVGALSGCMLEEITVRTEDIELDQSNEYSWTTWNLEDVDRVKHYTIDERYSNMNFKMVKWLNVEPKTDHCDVLSMNVHMFSPVVEVQSMENEFVSYVNAVNPLILTVQELPKNKAATLAAKCGFEYYWEVDNGSQNDAMKLAVFSKRPGNAQIINKRYDKNRGMILLKIYGRKLLFTHGPIGRSYTRGKKLEYIENFYSAYYHNRKLRDSYIRDLLSFRADLIIGDFNLIPEEKQYRHFLRAGYSTFDLDIPTSIHDVKVDYVWTKLPGRQTIYNWIYSDHRPIGFTFQSAEERKGGDDSIRSITYVLGALLILFVLAIVEALYQCWYNGQFGLKKLASCYAVCNSVATAEAED
jgi:hypothetical protein